MIELLKLSLISAFSQLGAKLFSEAMVKWMIMRGGDMLVKMTDTKHDDEFWNKLRETLNK